MANPEHVEILKQGVKVWNRWRKENREVRPDLGAANLVGADLTGANLSNLNLSDANLKGANLGRASLNATNCIMANATGANLSDTDLSGTDFSRDTGQSTSRPVSISSFRATRTSCSTQSLLTECSDKMRSMVGLRRMARSTTFSRRPAVA